YRGALRSTTLITTLPGRESGAHAVGEVTGLAGFELKRLMRTGTVASVDNLNWEIGDPAIIRRRSQSRAIALDMDSAAIAANGFRFRVPFGTLLCVSDKPLHGEYEIVQHDGGPRSKKFPATRKRSSTRMTRVSGTRKRPVGEIARTPSSGTKFKLFTARRARLTMHQKARDRRAARFLETEPA